jgi:tetratricopeptide (TPR) repeat protein
MVAERLQNASNRPIFIFSVLLLIAVAGFFAVNHLVTRFHEQEKALGRRLYGYAQAEQAKGDIDRAIPYLRAAISYNADDGNYQLSLARALRDTGRTEEAESYLIRLWESDPQDGPINLALGRLFVRENDVPRAIQYYHNAAYGLWPQSLTGYGLATRFELVRFLLQRKAFVDAQSELISISSGLPSDPPLHLQLADLFYQSQDFERALTEYGYVLSRNSGELQAATGAGKSAFQLRRFRDAERYLSQAEPGSEAKSLLEISRLAVSSNPYDPAISSAERVKRIKQAFEYAGRRLAQCADNRPQLEELKQRWNGAKPKVMRASARFDDDLNAIMAMVFEIEQQTQPCNPATAQDQALLLIANGQARTQP